jgi:hypothetical protein
MARSMSSAIFCNVSAASGSDAPSANFRQSAARSRSRPTISSTRITHSRCYVQQRATTGPPSAYTFYMGATVSRLSGALIAATTRCLVARDIFWFSRHRKGTSSARFGSEADASALTLPLNLSRQAQARRRDVRSFVFPPHRAASQHGRTRSGSSCATELAVSRTRQV